MNEGETKKKKILVIDDERDLLDLLKENLEAHGYEVKTAADGEEGIKRVFEFEPDLIICDINMPKKDGFQVLKEIKKEAQLKTPFIMLTVINDFYKVREAYEDQADFYVTKPVEIRKLLNNIRIVLNISQGKQGI